MVVRRSLSICALATVLQCQVCRAGGEQRLRAGAAGLPTSRGGLFGAEAQEPKEWYRTGLAIGSIVLILLTAAAAALVLLCRRRRRLGAKTGTPADWTMSIPADHLPGVGEKPANGSCKTSPSRKISTVQAPWDKLVPGLGEALAVHLEEVDETGRKPSREEPSHLAKAEGETNGKKEVMQTAWEPMVLLGVAGHVTPARRRSVSLRVESDEEGGDAGEDKQTTGTGTQEGGPGEDCGNQRKRSVTFNRMVEEVQIMRV